jgi:lipoprotein-releasing system permease protein
MMSTNNKIAYAHLTSRVKQALVAVLSVTFGISMYIFMNSFMNGVNDAQTELAFSTLAHIRIYNDLPEDKTNLLKNSLTSNQVVHLRNAKIVQYTDGIKNSAEVLNILQKESEITGISEQVNINVFFRNGASKFSGQLSGINTTQEQELFKTGDYIKEGSWESLQYRNDGIILGIGLAKKLGLKLNDNISISTAEGITKNYKVLGMVETTLQNIDNFKGYVKISAARQFLSKNQSYVTDIQVNIKDYNQAKEVASKITPFIPYKVEAWQTANGQLEAGSELRNIIALSVSLTILLVAGFGIYNIMNMTVNEKIREIAILKAMGYNGNDIVHIFLLQSMIIGFLGGLVGLGLGYLVAYTVNQIPFGIANLETLPMTYNLKDYGLAFLFGLLTTFIAGYLPAKKASSVDPVTIIRG